MGRPPKTKREQGIELIQDDIRERVNIVKNSGEISVRRSPISQIDYETFLREESHLDMKREIAQLRAVTKGMDEVSSEYMSMHDFFLCDPKEYTKFMDVFSKTIERTGKLVEKMAKISEGVKIKVEIDYNYLIKFVQVVILPNIIDMDTRKRIQLAATNFIGKASPLDAKQLPDPTVDTTLFLMDDSAVIDIEKEPAVVDRKVSIQDFLNNMEF